jgi:hypothetical protein
MLQWTWDGDPRTYWGGTPQLHLREFAKLSAALCNRMSDAAFLNPIRIHWSPLERKNYATRFTCIDALNSQCISSHNSFWLNGSRGERH